MHKAEAVSDLNALKADYGDQKWFSTGEDAANLAILLLGPITP